MEANKKHSMPEECLDDANYSFKNIIIQIEPIVKAFHLSDVGNAERLAYYHGDKLRYCHSTGKWLYWTGKRWQIDSGGTEVYRLAKETVRNIYREAALTDDTDTRQKISKHAIQSEKASSIREMIALAQNEGDIPIHAYELDADQWLLNVENGTIDLRTGKLRPHSRKDLITKLVHTEYDPNAQCPTWEAFLWRIMNGNQELIRFLQKAVGYALTGDVSEQVMFFLYGYTGKNGKSTFLNTIRELLDDYSITMQPDSFMVKQSDRISNDIARLKGVRFVSTIEGEEGKRLAESLIKQLTGGDTISARFLHREYFDFKPTHKIFFATNHKPSIRGTDDAIWRRIRLIPFDVIIPEHERDPKLPEKLRAEWSGILRWAVEGCLLWQREGLGVPGAVVEATQEYREEMDVIGAFLADKCVIGSGYKTHSSELYEEYKTWCADNGEYQMTQSMFGRKLKERGFENVKSNGYKVWKDIGLARNIPVPFARIS
ncbi:hypothetical protein DNHGIG_23870 [Collibacillus ludicampi]|uniref:SF3 helicase domain-containing protein n=1 Tax=Collibacillus ludicampi TaxID=2771369 RepID=A0AAV4LGD9_9BACL|nr:phage/plasmid primase, P4 family [Collibacillus ludicampi]GIM46838.1 hypothetical protein DNHGIG_23870 [Collibacillus ludicampi]